MIESLSDISAIAILFFVGCTAGFLNVNAGGGSTLTLPALIFLGLDPSVANGTNRLAIIIQNISAVQSFKQSNYKDFSTSLKLSLFTLPGAIAGAFIATRINDELFQKILAIVIIGIIISMFIPQKKNSTDNSKPINNFLLYFSMIGIGFYGGFIQVGVGFLIMASLRYLMKLNLVMVNMHKVFIVLIYTLPAFFIFVLTDNVNWILGIVLAIGNATGAWWAEKFSVKKGEKFIKIILFVAVLIMALKLLNVF